MDVTNDDYIRLLSALLPPGPAWSASDPAIAGAAPSLTRVHQRADSALRIWGDTVVECVLNKLCPSHTYVIFKYPE
ncbi:TPA: hypothetical protein OU229_004366 [Escherichia coli]|nr:hypothetical protein [Escherichia coli]